MRDEVGRGGMATVFRATRRADGRSVAIKVLHRNLRAALGSERFLREVAILSRLQHPGILPVLASGEAGDLLYYVMPFIEGGTLRDRLRREPHLPIAEAAGITRAVLAALEYAHQQNIIHRDIKPENILLGDGTVVVADFGIARAILRSGGESISSTGMVIGTSTYMSPEQAAGESQLDGRTDIYSVGCVLYEMLAGTPPFTGSSDQAIRARHALEPPPPLRVVRPAVPQSLQLSVERALAKVPADRPESAASFSDALAGLGSLPLAAKPARAGRRRWLMALPAVAALAAVALVLDSLSESPPDPRRFIVLPFRHQGALPTGTFSGGKSARMVWQALSHWRDLELVDELLVEDRVGPLEGDSLTLSEAVRIARSLDAGRLVWGEVATEGDSTTIRITLFETGTDPPRTLARARAAFPVADVLPSSSRGPQAIAQGFARLTGGLLSPVLADSIPLSPGDTPYIGALLAMLSGDSALAIWDLPAARENYRRAATIDPAFAAPRLRLARASLWANRPVGEWLPAAQAAAAGRNQLTWFEQVEADALVALGRGKFPEACDGFRRIIGRDSLRVVGWLGLGECQLRDSIVVADSRSPSQWSFRGSYAAGIAAYSRALTMVPSSYQAFGGAALRRLSRKLMAEPNLGRRGVSESAPGKSFVASPSLVNDSVVFVPYPVEDAVAGRRIPPTKAAALEANRRTLLAITGAWIERFPTSLGAIAAHAEALELAGRLDAASGDNSALGLVRKLRRRSSSAGDPHAAVWEVRLLLKTRRFTAARLLAESTLAVAPRSPEEGLALASLAALLGQVHRAAHLLGEYGDTPFARPDGEFVTAPRDLAREAYRLLAYAAFGNPPDSVRIIADRLRETVRRRTEPSRRQATEEALLFQPSLLAFPLLAPPGGNFPVSRIEQAIAGGDPATARAALASLDSLRSSLSPGTVAPDHALLEARLYSMVGDTAKAMRRLESLLGSLPLVGTDVLSDVTQAAAIGRSMGFLDSLRNRPGSRGRDTALQALWRHADRH